MPPPESVRISTRRRRWRGSCASASRVASMWSAGGVRAGVPGPQQDRQRLPGAFGAVISEDSQRVMAVGLLPRGHGLLLLRARGHDRRVDIDRDQAAARAGRRVAGQCPRPAAGRRPALRGWPSAPAAHRAARRATSRETTGSEATGPNSSGCARSIATSARQSPPSASATARSVTIFPGLCTARAGRHRSSAAVQAAVQARDPQRPGQQQATGLGDDSGAVSGHHDLGTAGGKMHAESAFRTGADRTLDKPYSSRSKALFLSKRSSPDRCQAKARG